MFLEEIRNEKGKEVEVVNSTAINEITEERRSSYRYSLRRNECRENSQAVARFLGGTAEVIEGLCINDELCFEHMWVKFDNRHIDLTLELFDNPNISTKYYELISHPLQPLRQFKAPTELVFSQRTRRLLDAYYLENPSRREEYEKMKRDLNG